MKRQNLWIMLLFLANLAWGQNTVPSNVKNEAASQLSPKESRKLQKTLYALQWKAASGNTRAQYELGYILFLAKDYVSSEEFLKKAAKKGHADAQFMLGLFYSEGMGVRKSYQEAVRWWRQAASQDNADALSSLGDCYLKGDGVENNPAEAVNLFQKAVAQGNVYAMLALGRCYEYGEGVEQNMLQAVHYYEKALEADVRTLALLAEIPGILGNDPLALSHILYKYEAKLRLACIYGLGKGGVQKNVSKAYDLLKEEADTYANAQVLLGNIYYEDGTNGAPDSYEKAVSFFSKAKADNDASLSGAAAFFLSKCYRFGRGVPKDVAKADTLLKEATEKGWNEAKTLDDLLKKVTTSD